MSCGKHPLLKSRYRQECAPYFPYALQQYGDQMMERGPSRSQQFDKRRDPLSRETPLAVHESSFTRSALIQGDSGYPKMDRWRAELKLPD
jgi:hypothetical protein